MVAGELHTSAEMKGQDALVMAANISFRYLPNPLSDSA
jgi:hypothetical protein